MKTIQKDPRRKIWDLGKNLDEREAIKQRLRERDENLCKLCGGPCIRQHPWPDPKSESWDHRIPHTVGGATEEENLDLTHTECNQKKGATFNPEETPAIRLQNGTLIPATEKEAYEKRTGEKTKGKIFVIRSRNDPNRVRRTEKGIWNGSSDNERMILLGATILVTAVAATGTLLWKKNKKKHEPKDSE